MTMLAAGKRYVRRDRSISPPLVHEDGVLVDPGTGMLFTVGEALPALCVGVEIEEDLIEEVAE